MQKEEIILSGLFESWAKESPQSILPLPGSGSYRRYYRIQGKGINVLGVYNEDRKENTAFLSFTDTFHRAGFPVPEIYISDPEKSVYLLEDLGDTTLFNLIERSRDSVTGSNPSFPAEALGIYHEVVKWLPLFQTRGSSLISFNDCYPRSAFDLQSMRWDLNYFKYYFLKLARVPFDEQRLEDDFDILTGFLTSAGSGFFMYRDFQSRNIMVYEDKPWFIDYQGGRKGPLQYDIASLLYDAKAVIPDTVREELLSAYLDHLEKIIPLDREKFLHYYYGFVLIRILQALGAYGFRGYYENKPHFLLSIPYALQNLKSLMEKNRITLELPMLMQALNSVIANPRFYAPSVSENNLTVTITSFSYKKSIPEDQSGNGGGFIFDCRALPNPGKFEEYRQLTGKDQPVIDFLKKETAVDEFLNHVSALVDQSIKRYAERDFQSLVVGFGCTGGQHRSVYCAEQLAKHIQQKFPVKVVVSHTEFP